MAYTNLVLPQNKEGGREAWFSRKRPLFPLPNLPFLLKGIEGLQKFPDSPVEPDKVGNRIGSFRTDNGVSVARGEITLTPRPGPRERT